MEHTTLLVDLAVILCIAAVVTVLFQKLRQPVVLGYLTAGIIIGPYTPPFMLVTDVDGIRVLAELGVIFLMFAHGLEFTFRKIAKVGVAAVGIALFEVAVMWGIGYVAGGVLNWDPYDRILLGGALAISSTTIVLKALDSFGVKHEWYAQLTVGVLLVEDFIAMCLLALLTTMTGKQELVLSQALVEVSELVLVVGGSILVGYCIVPYIMRRMRALLNHEMLTIIATGLCLMVSALAVEFRYSAALGAFLMGSVLAVTPQVHRIVGVMTPLKDVFAAVFFVSVGMLVDPYLIVPHWQYVLALSVVTIVGKAAASVGGALLARQSKGTAMQLGCAMAQIGEFSFIIIGVGGMLHATNEALYPIVVAVAVITTFTTPYMIQWSHRWKEEGIGAPTRRLPPMRLATNLLVLALLCSIAWQITHHTSSLPLHIVAWIVACLLALPSLWALLHAAAPGFANRLQPLKTIYHAIESYLLDHLTHQDEKADDLLSQLSPSEYSLLRIKASASLPFIGKSLAESHLRSSFGITIAAIKREDHTTWIPEPQERILPNDELVVLGDKHALQRFMHFVQASNLQQMARQPEPDLEEHPSLTKMVLKPTNPLVNRSIQECRGREQFQGMIVAIERAGHRTVNPDPSTVLQSGDALVILTKKREPS